MSNTPSNAEMVSRWVAGWRGVSRLTAEEAADAENAFETLRGDDRAADARAIAVLRELVDAGKRGAWWTAFQWEVLEREQEETAADKRAREYARVISAGAARREMAKALSEARRWQLREERARAMAEQHRRRAETISADIAREEAAEADAQLERAENAAAEAEKEAQAVAEATAAARRAVQERRAALRAAREQGNKQPPEPGRRDQRAQAATVARNGAVQGRRTATPMEGA